jgi:ADP-ribose pyrophosphatase YjhB (NUDIX family)
VVQAAETFKRAGLRVLTPTVSDIVNHGAPFVRFASDPPFMSDHDIQTATFERIFASDFVYVVAPDGYIGPTTGYELGRITERGMTVYFSEQPGDMPIELTEGSVLSPQELVERVRAGAGKAWVRPRVSAQPTADLVILTIRNDRLNVLVVVRDNEPFRGRLALPGGFLLHHLGETLEEAAARELEEETGLVASDLPLEQIETYSKLDRDPRGRVITTAFLAIAPDLPIPTAGTDARRADWVEYEKSLRRQLAFDHWKILTDAVEHARKLLECTPIASAFCGETFTISELRRVYEIVWGTSIEPSNFHRKVVEGVPGFVEAIGQKREPAPGRPGRPAELYRRGPATDLYPPVLRPPTVLVGNGNSVGNGNRNAGQVGSLSGG